MRQLTLCVAILLYSALLGATDLVAIEEISAPLFLAAVGEIAILHVPAGSEITVAVAALFDQVRHLCTFLVFFLMLLRFSSLSVSVPKPADCTLAWTRVCAARFWSRRCVR